MSWQRKVEIHWPTVVAVAVVVYGTAVMLHELGHVAAGWLGGGAPDFVSSTDTRGDWSAMGRGGFVALGASGSAVNVALAALGLVLLGRLRRHQPRGGGYLFAWLLFAVNATLAGVYLTISPLAAFGDWNTVLRRFEPQVPLRLLAAAAGAAMTVWATRTAARALRPLISSLPAERRTTLTLRLVRTCWLAGTAAAVAAALLSPLGLGWALFIATGSTLGCTWPMLLAARRAAEGDRAGPRTDDGGLEQAGQGADDGPVELVGAHRGWIAAGVVVAAVFVFVFGPGIDF